VNQTGITVSNYTVSPPINLANNTQYFWRVNGVSGFGTGPYSVVRTFATGMVGIINNQEIPVEFKVYQNYPNPFNPFTKIRFDLPAGNENQGLRLIIYDASGSLVREVMNTDYTPGIWEIDIDGTGLASGVYFYRVEAGMYTAVNKMVMVK
jgi:hypothetical protein